MLLIAVCVAHILEIFTKLWHVMEVSQHLKIVRATLVHILACHAQFWLTMTKILERC